LRKDQNLDVIDAKKNSIYKHTFIFKEVEQDQVLTKVDKPDDKQFEEILSMKDDILEEVAKEGNLELIEENAESLEAKIIGNIVEDSTEVKHEGESITHDSRDLVDFLKIATTQSIDFVGVENFYFDVANKLKANEKKFYVTLSEGYKFQNQIKLLRYLKYLFIWSGRFQLSKENLRMSFIQVKGFQFIFFFYHF
jgi:hypothetical protein